MKLKSSARERWIVTAQPTLLIFFIYFFFYADGIAANLEREQARLAAASKPLPIAAPPASLGNARKALADVKQGIAERQERISKLEEKLAAAQHENGIAEPAIRDPAQIIGKVEAVFAHFDITPVVSEAAGEGQSGNQAPAPLLALFAPKSEFDAPTAHKDSRIWHFIFDNQTASFERALKELIRKIPAVAPLSLNFAYNPENDGESRLLELWLVY